MSFDEIIITYYNSKVLQKNYFYCKIITMIYDFYAKKAYELFQIPTRLLKNDEVVAFHQRAEYKCDLAALAEGSFDFKNRLAAVVITQNYFYFAKILIEDSNYSLLIGPCFNTLPSDKISTSVINALGLPAKELVPIEEYFKTLPELDLRTFLNYVILLDALINNEEIEHRDLILSKKVPKNAYEVDFSEKNKKASFAEREDADKLSKTAEFYVKNGMVEDLEKLYGLSDSRYVGKMANDSVRQARNTFIVSATIFSRAAIDGGLDLNTALSMSDIYIQKVEMLSDYYAIMTLQSEMIINFAKAVASLNTKGSSGAFVSGVRSYIFNHINEKIYVDDLAKSLFVNKSYLTMKFKSLTGKTLVEYITDIKIDEAKRLLKVTNDSLSEISEKLAFSSQSYFQNVFKKKTGMTPSDYKEQL